MNLVLLSLSSQKSASAGLMVYDIDSSSACYLQLVDFHNLPIQSHLIRGISLVGKQLYALLPCAMLNYKISKHQNKPKLKLENVLCKPEWIFGNKQQGDLHAIHVSRKRQRVYISFNNQCSIDVFDLKGNFVQRQNLWDIAPDIFAIPSSPIEIGFRYGVVRHIFETEHEELMLTTSMINGKKDSAVISYDEGKRVLGFESQLLHGGLIEDGFLYVSAIQKGEVQAFAWPKNQKYPDTEPTKRFSPRITDSKWKNSDQKVRGMIVQNGRLLCGVCFFGKPKKNQIPPRIVEFDLQSGEQVREHWLPSFQGFEEPHIYGMIPSSKELEQAITLIDEPVFYHGDTLISPVWTVRDAPTVTLPKINEKHTNKVVADPNRLIKVNRIEETRDCATAENSLNNKPLSEIIGGNRNFLFNVGKDLSPSAAYDFKVTLQQSTNLEPGSQNSVQPTVVFETVGLCFERAARKFLFLNKNLRHKKSFWALKDISFTLYEGETLGIIGRNGSGKSTLSMICSGVLIPDRGKVRVHGRVQLLALGVGFKTELSGRENVFISGSLMGLSKKEIKARMDEIEDFAELGEFMDEPVRTYSSGMRSRLGFAVATAVRPDILVLDEIMATGDKAFQDKAMRRMREMRGLARSVIVVSHNPRQLRKLSSRVLWLEKGRMFMIGQPKEVLNAYDNFCQSPQKWLRNHPDLACKISV